MRKKIVFIGGDERQTVAAEEFAKDGFDVRLFGCPSGNGRLESAKTLSDAVADSVAAILPVPCSKDGKTVFAPFAEEPIRADEV
ncbi:MAG: dipicolinate synthase subunit DpsA, partial [Eubacteriales bacterium]|nr:dipicolinate synthase subunit DpsA [Eubacteriales bacterium]